MICAKEIKMLTQAGAALGLRHEAREPLSTPHLASGFPCNHKGHIPSRLACNGYNHKGHTPSNLAWHRYSRQTVAQQCAERGDRGEAVNDG